MSGTGKSTALAELARRGHRVVDADLPGWSVEVSLPDGSGFQQLWREEPMRALLAEDLRGLLFVAGCASNQRSFRSRFDAVVLLSVPREVLLDRVARRTTNAFGKSGVERERILRDLHEVEPLLRATATLEVDTRLPVPEVADKLESVARRATGTG